MSRSSPEPNDPPSPVSNEAVRGQLVGKTAAEKEMDLLSQIYASLGIDYDPVTGEYRVRD